MLVPGTKVAHEFPASYQRFPSASDEANMSFVSACPFEYAIWDEL